MLNLVRMQGNLTQLVMAAEGATPSRMNREGAARTYSLYQCVSRPAAMTAETAISKQPLSGIGCGEGIKLNSDACISR